MGLPSPTTIVLRYDACFKIVAKVADAALGFKADTNYAMNLHIFADLLTHPPNIEDLSVHKTGIGGRVEDLDVLTPQLKELRLENFISEPESRPMLVVEPLIKRSFCFHPSSYPKVQLKHPHRSLRKDVSWSLSIMQ